MLVRATLLMIAGLGFGAVAFAPPALAQTAVSSPTRLFADSQMLTRDRISVETIGSGPDIVFIPGLASSRETFRHSAERMRGRFSVHLIQIAGFAGDPARGNGSADFFDPVLAEIDGYLATLGHPIVIGHSLGGTLGLALAERHPEHVSKLMIVDSLPFYGVLMGGPAATADSVRPIAQAMKAHAGAMPEPQMRAMMAQMVTAPADVERVVGWSKASDPGVVGRAMADDMTTDLRPGLAAVRTPVTVLYETPLEAPITSGYAALSTKTLVPVPGAKHFIMYDQPAKFDAEVDAFLAR